MQRRRSATTGDCLRHECFWYVLVVLIRYIRLIVGPFPPLTVSLRAKFLVLHRIARHDGVSVAVERAQFASGVLSPSGQVDAISLAFVSVRGETLAVAHLGRTLAHVHFAELEVFVWIDARLAVLEDIIAGLF